MSASRTYVLVEGHGEQEAVLNLLTRLVQDRNLAVPRFAQPRRVPGVASEEVMLRHVERVRCDPDAGALLLLRDDEDGCPKEDAPRLAARLRALGLPFPVAVVLAYREYESLFLPCIERMAGKPLAGTGGARPGLVAGARYDGDFEAKRGVKEWLSGQMPKGRKYKPPVDQLPLTQMVHFATVREKGLPWFGSLERALRFLADNRGQSATAYPPEPARAS